MEDNKQKKSLEVLKPEFISLNQAAKLCPYSAEYLGLRSRQGKLKAEKINGVWVTKKEWLDDYLKTRQRLAPEKVMRVGSQLKTTSDKATSKIINVLKKKAELVKGEKIKFMSGLHLPDFHLPKLRLPKLHLPEFHFEKIFSAAIAKTNLFFDFIGQKWEDSFTLVFDAFYSWHKKLKLEWEFCEKYFWESSAGQSLKYLAPLSVIILIGISFFQNPEDFALIGQALKNKAVGYFIQLEDGSLEISKTFSSLPEKITHKAVDFKNDLAASREILVQKSLTIFPPAKDSVVELENQIILSTVKIGEAALNFAPAILSYSDLVLENSVSVLQNLDDALINLPQTTLAFQEKTEDFLTGANYLVSGRLAALSQTLKDSPQRIVWAYFDLDQKNETAKDSLRHFVFREKIALVSFFDKTFSQQAREEFVSESFSQAYDSYLVVKQKTSNLVFSSFNSIRTLPTFFASQAQTASQLTQEIQQKASSFVNSFWQQTKTAFNVLIPELTPFGQLTQQWEKKPLAQQPVVPVQPTPLPTATPQIPPSPSAGSGQALPLQREEKETPAPQIQTITKIETIQRIEKIDQEVLGTYATPTDLTILEAKLLTLITNSKKDAIAQSALYTTNNFYSWAPTQKIDNLGNITVTGTFSVGGLSWPSTKGAPGQVLTSNGTSEFYWTTLPTAVNPGLAGFLPFYKTSGSTLSQTSALFWDDTNQRLGVGTTSPYAKLSVVGPVVAEYFIATSTIATSTFSGGVSFGSHLAFTNTATSSVILANGLNFANNTLVIDPNSGRVGIGTASPVSLFDVNSKFNVLSSGYVGIGTTSPFVQLSVAGIGSFDDYVRASYFLATSTSQASSFPYASTTALTVSNTASTTELYVSHNTYLSTLIPGSVIFAGANGLVSQNNSNLYWDNINLNLGIGTTSPYAKLSVEGFSVLGNSALAGYFTATTTTATSTFAGGLSAASSLYVLQNGYVGIGTANPVSLFSVNGNAYFNGISTTTGQAIFTYAPQTAGVNNVYNSSLYINSNGASADANLLGVADSGAWKFRVDKEGDVFIQGNLTTAGVVSQATTQVTGNLIVEGYSMLGDAPNNDYVQIKGYTNISASSTQSALTITQSLTGNILDVFDDTTKVFTILDGGFVGIGTTTPYSKLSVWGSGTGTNRFFELTNNASTTLMSVLENGQCVTGDTELLIVESKAISNFQFPISNQIPISNDQIKKTRIDQIKGGEYVLSLNEKTGKLVPAKIKGLLDMGVKPIYKIETEDGKTIRTTGNHPYLVKTKSIAFLSMPDTTNDNGVIDDSENNAIVAGAKTESGSAVIAPELQNISALQRVNQLADSQNVSKDLLLDAFRQSFNFFGSQSGELIAEHNYTFSDFLNASPSTKPSFLAFLKSRLISAATLGREYEIKSSISSNSSLDKSLAGANTPRRFLSLTIVKDDSLVIQDNDSKNEKNLSRPEWVRVAYLQVDDEITVTTDDLKDIKFVKIKRITQLPSEQVYDIEVENTHNFVANEILAHNTYISGNLGLGTTSPYAKLSIEGSSVLGNSALAGYFIATTTTATSTFAGGLVAGNGSLNVLQNGNVGIGTASPASLFDVNSKFNVLSSGNIGIATTSPFARLSVAGIGSFDDYVRASYFMATSTTASTFPYASTTALTISGTASTTNLYISGSGYLSNMTTGSILFAGTSGILSQNNSNLYWDNTNLNLGIGTTSPYAKLSVAGRGVFDQDVRADYFTATSTSTSATSTFPYLSAAQSNVGTVVGGTWQGTAIGDAYLTKTGNWTGTFDGQEGTYYLNALNLTNFGAPFYTFFSATTTNALAEGSTNKYWSNTLFDNRLSATSTLPNLTTLLGLTNASSTQLTTTGSTYLATTGGNVGIGTTGPGRKLEINTGAATGGSRLTYNDSDGSATTYADFLINSGGDLTITTTGGDISFDNENLTTTGGGTFGDTYFSRSQYALDYMATAGKDIALASLGSKTNILRAKTIYALEYYDGADWLTWSTTATNINDGNFTSTFSIDATHKKWRITFSGMNWKREFAWSWMKYYSAAGYSADYSVLLETSTDAITWTTVKDYGTITDNSYQYVFFGVGESINAYRRFTFDFSTLTGADTVIFQEIQMYSFDPSQNPDPIQFTGVDDARIIDTFSVGGNVGIGTTTPNSLLSLYQNSADTALTFGDTNTTRWTMGSDYSDSQKFKIEAASSLGGATPAFVITSAGNLGIGTSSPWAKLSVEQNAGETGFSIGSSTATNFIVDKNGNVGIGTAAPNSKLEVSTPTGNLPSAIFHHTGGQGWANVVSLVTDNTGGNDEPRLLFSYKAGTKAWGIGGYNSGLGTANTFNIWEDSNAAWGTQRVTILPGGNVGIGTTSPTYKLSVEGIGSFGDYARASYFVATSTTATSTFAGGLVAGNNAGLTVNMAAPANSLYINPAGNVGIGTTSPQAKLTVENTADSDTGIYAVNYNSSGTTAGASLLAKADWGNVYMSARGSGRTTTRYGVVMGGYGEISTDAGNGLMIGTRTATPLILGTNNADRLHIDSSGNVGIGTTTPNWLLQVSGTKPSLALSDYSASANLKHWLFSSMGGNLYIGTSTDSYATSTPAALMILNNGNVGIGTIVTSTSSYKLDVASGGVATARFGSAAGDTVIVGGGAGKLTVGGVDPPFTIAGQGKYATYGLSMAGMHEETTGVVQLTGGEYVIDFNELEKDSDLWLFYQITDFGESWGKLTVLLSAEGPGGVWYKKEPASNRLIIYSETASYVSYRLTAPRFDWKKWLTVRGDGEVTGLLVNEIINNRYAQTTSTNIQAVIDSAGQKEESLFGEFISKIKKTLASLGMFVENGIVKAKELFVERVITKEIQMVDKATGENYCTWIENDEWVKEKGECGQVSPSTTEAPSDELQLNSLNQNSPDQIIEPPSSPEGEPSVSGSDQTTELAPEPETTDVIEPIEPTEESDTLISTPETTSTPEPEISTPEPEPEPAE